MSNAKYKQPAGPTDEQRAVHHAVKNLLIAAEAAKLAHDIIKPYMRKVSLVQGNQERPPTPNIIAILSAETAEVVMGTLLNSGILSAPEPDENPEPEQPDEQPDASLKIVREP